MTLEQSMRAIEAAAVAGEPSPAPASSQQLHFAALAGLGSKYLALGTPASLGLIGDSSAAPALLAVHQLLFGPLEIRYADQLSIEEALASDIVCLPTSSEFEVQWIADATHLNLIDSGHWSAGATELLRSAQIATVGAPQRPIPNHHGSLADVITGKVSGRMGEELTGLLWSPPRS